MKICIKKDMNLAIINRIKNKNRIIVTKNLINKRIAKRINNIDKTKKDLHLLHRVTQIHNHLHRLALLIQIEFVINLYIF